MKYIIDFYNELDILNLIIFWGIIIVITLLLIFSIILINKNKKLKKIVAKQNNYEEEIPILKNEEVLLPEEQEYQQNEPNKKEIIPQIEEEIEKEKNIKEYRNNLFELSPQPKKDEIKEIKEESIKTQIPNAPYQRNVLREMSLSQTSPIGINSQRTSNLPKIELAKDLEDALNDKESESDLEKIKINEEIKEDLTNIKNESSRKTEIIIPKETKEFVKEEITLVKESKEIYPEISSNQDNEKSRIQTQNEQYLEEVSRKLAEAEIPDEIERTTYELKQEEDAIISYKELMEKKDSIETIDEEDAIISIEELMNRKNTKEEQQEISKLYNLTEEEGNDDFIKELKQFRKDL